MMRKARLAIRKVNVALDNPGYCFGTGRSLTCSLSAFSSANEDQVNENAYQYYRHDNQMLTLRKRSRAGSRRYNARAHA